MKVHAAISWFHESPSWLAATVASVARLCDHVVVVDGRYSLFPSDLPVSPVAEAQTIVETAEGAGVALTMHRPAGPFQGNEVEKRNLLLSLALVSCQPEDWLLVIDGDMYIRHLERDRLMEALAATDRLAASYALEEYMDMHNPDQPMDVARTMLLDNVFQSPLTTLYRAVPGMRYEGSHHSLAADIDGERVWLWGHPEKVEPLHVMDMLVVRHRNVLRTQWRRKQAADYYEQRDRLEIEHIPG